ncbi:hypothetical protein Pfo_003576 [Paulownia fortunei]|nr:hypothetical protein Pfo_003576 [Paulownia fortunei]
MINEIRYHVSKDQAYRTKRKALKLIKDSPDIQYTKLWDYVEELRKTNHGLIIILGIDFSGCRLIIVVDGCHLKGPYGGVLLTIVGVDRNNNLYSIAYAIVCKECREIWEWFLIILKKDLNIIRTHEYTFQEVSPNLDHGFCVRYLHNNFKNIGFRGLAFKNALWRAARASTPGEFKVRIKEMRDVNKSTTNWFNDKPPNQWSRFYFSEHCKCDMLLNNVCESFNSNILDAREKPIITMFEWIREFLMRRLQENRDKAEAKWKGKLCPKIKKIIEKHVEKVGDCIPIKAYDRHYQISCIDGSQYCVDLEKWSCTCRMWGLSGIPCKHAICAIFNQNQLSDDFVHLCYTVETYKKVYEHAIMGISGEQLWGEIMFIPPLPPNSGRGVGRPSKARRREPDEVNVKQKKRSKGKQLIRMERQQGTVKCRICGALGHNAVTCKKKKKGSEATSLDNLTCQMDSIVADDSLGEQNVVHRPPRKKLMVSFSSFFFKFTS